jgi:hypothetical protein
MPIFIWISHGISTPKLNDASVQRSDSNIDLSWIKTSDIGNFSAAESS